MSGRQSPRQELGEFAHSMRLRQAVQGKLSEEAEDLLCRVVARYCEPPRRARKRKRYVSVSDYLSDHEYSDAEKGHE